MKHEEITKLKYRNQVLQYEYVALGALTIATVLSGIALNASRVFADPTTAGASVNVSSACTLTGTNTTHSDDITNGVTTSDIGTSTLKATCNDGNGFAIYAIGYTNDTLGNTVLSSGTHNIATGTNTSGNSSWAMKLATTANPTYPIIISGSSDDSGAQSLDPDYSAYQSVPSTYTKVAYRTSGTDSGQSAIGSLLTTTYQVYASSTQSAGTYEGQVKYVLVHPNNKPAPTMPPASCSTPVPGITYLQDITSSNRTTILSSLEYDAFYYLRDSRDEETYCVTRLRDNNLWLADNLRLDITNNSILSNMDSSNTNASNTTLSYLKGSISRNPSTDPTGNYATTGITNWVSSYSYSAPLASATYKNDASSGDTFNDDSSTWKYGVYYNYCAASAGSYCYGNDGDYGQVTGTATEDICPKGWKMPSGGANGDYNTLYANSYYDTYDEYRAALRLPMSGNFTDGTAYAQTGYGFYWSSTGYSNSDALYLYADQSTVNPLANYSRSHGYTMRCILNSQ